MALKHDPAFPCNEKTSWTCTGITYRQWMVGEIAASLSSRGRWDGSDNADLAKQAAAFADAVIEEERRTASTRLVHEKPVPHAIPVDESELIYDLVCACQVAQTAIMWARTQTPGNIRQFDETLEMLRTVLAKTLDHASGRAVDDNELVGELGVPAVNSIREDDGTPE